MPSAEHLAELIERLESQGLDTGQLPQIQGELVRLAGGGGFLARLMAQVRATADRQWTHAQAELAESRAALDLMIRRVTDDGAPLSSEERAAFSEQARDLLRVIPSGVLTLAIEAIPLPGTSLATPWLLSRLGLLPSRWREARLLESLHAEAERLRAAHADAIAQELEEVEREVADEAADRERVSHGAALLTHWDADGDGRWDPEERAAYDVEVERLRRIAEQRAADKRWFLSYCHHPFGPVRLSELLDAGASERLMVSFDGKTGWVCLADLQWPPLTSCDSGRSRERKVR